MASLRIGIFGAGAIGGWLGARLSAAGADVTLVARPSLVDVAPSIRAVDDAGSLHVPRRLFVTDDPTALADVEVCLVTTKSDDTPTAARALAAVLDSDAVVVSFQNGLANVPVLKQRLPNRVAAGMVTFNVVREGKGGATFRKTTTGPILAERLSGPAGHRMDALAALLSKAGEPLGLRDDMEAVQAGKLLLNLNNGLCALTGLGIADSIRSPHLRRCFAACLREGLDVFQHAGLPHVALGRLSPRLLSRVLLLPDPLIRVLAGRFMAIHPEARSSTLQDLDRGRRTEIDHLNGAIVTLAQEAGVTAPVNDFVTRQVHVLEKLALKGVRPLPFLTPEEAWAGLHAARNSAGNGATAEGRSASEPNEPPNGNRG